jgi:hypothetical protein
MPEIARYLRICSEDIPGTMILGCTGIAHDNDRLWHHPYVASFAIMKNARVMGSWRLLSKLQRKACGTKHCVVKSESLQEASDRARCRIVRVKQKLKWRGARNAEHLPREALGSK